MTPHQSRAASPTLVQTSGRISPFKGRGFKSNPSSQHNSRPTSPKNHKSTPSTKGENALFTHGKGFKVLSDITDSSNKSENKNHDYENLQKIQNNISAIETVNKAMSQKPPAHRAVRRTALPPIRNSKIPRRQSLSTGSSPVHKTLKRKASISPARSKTPISTRTISRRGVSLSPARQKSLAASTLSKSVSKLNVPLSQDTSKSPTRNTISSSYKIVSKSPKATRRNPDLVKREEALKRQQIRRNTNKPPNSTIKMPNLSPIEGTPTKVDKKPINSRNKNVLPKVNSRSNIRNNGPAKEVKSPTRIPTRSSSKSNLANSETSLDNSSKSTEREKTANKNTKTNKINNSTKESNNVKKNDSENNKQDDKNEFEHEHMAIQTSSDSIDKDASTNTEKLVPLTKSNVISMTTAAITAQPVQIATNVTNQIVEQTENNSNDSVDLDVEEVTIESNQDNTKLYKSETVIEFKQKESSETTNTMENKTMNKETSNDETKSVVNSTVVGNGNVEDKNMDSKQVEQENNDNQKMNMDITRSEIKVSSVDVVPVVPVSVERKLSNKAIAEVKGVVQVEPIERNTVVSDNKVKAETLMSAAEDTHLANSVIESKEIITEQTLKQLPDAEVQSGYIHSNEKSLEPSLINQQ